MTTGVKDELQRTVLYAKELAKATQLLTRPDQCALHYNIGSCSLDDSIPVGRIAGSISHEGRINIVTDDCIRLFGLEALNTADGSTADHLQEIGEDSSSFGLQLRRGLVNTLILEEQTNAHSNTAVSAKDTFKQICVVDIRLIAKLVIFLILA
jgi:hypothetical protein